MKRCNLLILMFLFFCGRAWGQELYHEQYRPQLHFSPKAKWMNDPNGLVYFGGVYHMFFQYYPDSTVWGPSHWGHATSTDLLHWKELPIAFYPDSLGIMASGSCVVDSLNTSGFGLNGNVPLVAIFTQIGLVGKKDWIENSQKQSIAYSLDGGSTWTRYKQNPVIANPGLKDFRDPKVAWYAHLNQWIMTVATHDHVTYFSSANLKQWKKESEFGQGIGGHNGVWECPDLIHLLVNNKPLWVQIVSVNPGGPNGGSATQYFVGDFNGYKFTPFSTREKWLDYGTDNYAGVTWANTTGRTVLLGWMSNWEYANVVPTVNWRSAMTLNRTLDLKKVGSEYYLTSMPVKEYAGLESGSVVPVTSELGNDRSALIKPTGSQYKLEIKPAKLQDLSLVFSNGVGETLVAGFDKAKNAYYIDRTKSGTVDFEKGFAKKFYGPRISTSGSMKLTCIVDVSSIELFADDGLTVMTAVFFPSKPYNEVHVSSSTSLKDAVVRYSNMKSIW